MPSRSAAGMVKVPLRTSRVTSAVLTSPLTLLASVVKYSAVIWVGSLTSLMLNSTGQSEPMAGSGSLMVTSGLTT